VHAWEEVCSGGYLFADAEVDSYTPTGVQECASAPALGSSCSTWVCSEHGDIACCCKFLMAKGSSGASFVGKVPDIDVCVIQMCSFFSFYYSQEI